MKKILAFTLTLVLCLSLLMPLSATMISAEKSPDYKGKVFSILGDSISTFAGYIPVADGFNLKHYARYPQDNLFTDVNETWWMQVLTTLDAKLGINESWRSTEVYNYIDAEVNSTYDGTKACMASLTRIQNLGSNGTPDVILFYGGTNDITQNRPVGTFDPATAPTEVDLTSLKWESVADAYVDAIMRMQYYYPDALIVAMFPTYTYKNTDARIEPYNSVFAQICKHYGVPYMDLRDSGVTKSYLPDGTHPNAAGMDMITDMVLGVLSQCEMESGETVVHSITHNLSGAKSSLGYYKGINHGKPFVTEITGTDLKVSVVMNGVDITTTTYKDGVVTIPAVTGDVVITAQAKAVYEDYIQQLPTQLCRGTNLWTILTPENIYYTGSTWGVNATGQVHSVTFAVNPGDRIWATSFQKGGSNGSSGNGIRLTWFNQGDVLKSISPTNVYNEFKENGYLTAPQGAFAVNVAMWNNETTNELYVLNPDHIFVDGICTICNLDHSQGHVYDDTCDTECNTCANTRNPEHNYDNDCDTDCNSCGDVRTVAGHQYDNALDPDCNECGAVRTITPAKKNGWVSNGGKWYYYENDVMVKSAWRRDSIGWVYLAADGAMKTNAWVRDSIGWCYVGASGYAVTNSWKKDSVGWCYLNASGSMTKNAWVKDGGNRYYLNGAGYRVTGTKVIDGKTYKFNSNGILVS